MAKKSSAPEPVIETPVEEQTIGKGHATPTRKEREAANKRPLVPTDRKQASREAREKQMVLRDKARVGMANGEEKYLPVRDKGAQRRYVRDYVDARFNLGEFLIPAMFVVILLTLVPAPEIQAGVMLGLYAFVVLVIADSIFLGFRLMKKLREKFGADKVERGVRWYATMRALQFRRLRLPKPQVKRGQYPS
ncbi:DUF3043 domain-containing protein [Herbiconiux moechotypicola]|uniref:DUF3043 domain-containing protein n=1 Tax=Herbiconiux moechotypicola TaxID=637393 RepID=A0ABN3E5E5_9MICO|nr:DUF3043 domain-containing protein [Herbiconiux moechotypicola]MCS5731851.1 DUF3043 domain-containing protein [Herbiconiux moechotypicola]